MKIKDFNKLEIQEINKLTGKTIKKLHFLTLSDNIALTFTDGTFVRFQPYHEYDEIGITFPSRNPLTEYDLFEMGFIDQKEYNSLIKHAEQSRKAKKEQEERKELQRLLLKYTEQQGNKK